MEYSPNLSIIIPAYNVKAYIRQAVESALRQSWKQMEIIIIDDGSTDGTLGALDTLDDPRLRRVRQVHAGLAAARNAGIRAARGEYLGFLDGDDLWASTKADRHLLFFRNHPEIDLTFSFAWIIDGSGLKIAPLRPGVSGILSFQDLLIECPHCNAILRREAIDRAGFFDTSLVASEDLDMWLRIAKQRERNIYCIPEFLAFYRRRKGQLTEDWPRMNEAWMQLFEKLYPLVPEEFHKSVMRAHQTRYRYYASLAYGKKRYGEAIGLLQTSIRHAPWKAIWDIRMWFLTAACLSGILLPSKVHQSLRKGIAWSRRSLQRRNLQTD